jgi:hypothetical protein
MGMIHQRQRPSPALKRTKSSGNSRLVVIASGIFCLGAFTLFPILVLESASSAHNNMNNASTTPVFDKNNNNRISVDHAVRGAAGGTTTNSRMLIPPPQLQQPQSKPDPTRTVNADGAVVVVVDRGGAAAAARTEPLLSPPAVKDSSSSMTTTTRTTKDGRKLPVIAVGDLETDENKIDRSVIGRGVAAVSSTLVSPLLAPAQRAPIDCDINVDSLAYWNVGELQPETNPFHSEGYITFAPDRGGWNNVRYMGSFLICLVGVVVVVVVVFSYTSHMVKKNSRQQFFIFFFYSCPFEKTHLSSYTLYL